MHYIKTLTCMVSLLCATAHASSLKDSSYKTEGPDVQSNMTALPQVKQKSYTYAAGLARIALALHPKTYQTRTAQSAVVILDTSLLLGAATFAAHKSGVLPRVAAWILTHPKESALISTGLAFTGWAIKHFLSQRSTSKTAQEKPSQVGTTSISSDTASLPSIIDEQHMVQVASTPIIPPVAADRTTQSLPAIEPEVETIEVKFKSLTGEDIYITFKSNDNVIDQIQQALGAREWFLMYDSQIITTENMTFEFMKALDPYKKIFIRKGLNLEKI